MRKIERKNEKDRKLQFLIPKKYVIATYNTQSYEYNMKYCHGFYIGQFIEQIIKKLFINIFLTT